MIPRRRWRAGQRGIIRGCCLGLVFLVASLAFAAWCTDRALAAPDLGAPPAGPDDGSSEVQIAVVLAAQLAPRLAAAPHAAVTLSERDLTVLAQAHNPHPDRYTNLSVRVRDGLLVIAANDHYGPFTVTPVLRLALQLTGTDPTTVALHVQTLDVGELPLPGYIRDHFVGELPSAVAIPSLFGSNPALKALSNNIECAAVVTGGVVIGVHRPGTGADPSKCGTTRP